MIFLIGILLAKSTNGSTVRFFVMMSTVVLLSSLIVFCSIKLFRKSTRRFMKLIFACLEGIFVLQLFCACTFLELEPTVLTLRPIDAIADDHNTFDVLYMPQSEAVLVCSLPKELSHGRGTVSFEALTELTEAETLPPLDDQYSYLFVKGCDSVTITYSVWDKGNDWECSFRGYRHVYNIGVLRNTETNDGTVYVFQLKQANVSMSEYPGHYFNYLGLWIER